MMWDNSFFFCMPNFHSIFWRDCPYSKVCSLFLWQKSIIHLCADFFWALNSVSLVMYHSIFFFLVSSVHFLIGKDVCQGCMLSSCLFNFYAEYIMKNARLDEAQARIKISGRNINNLRSVDDTTLNAESKERKSLLIKVKEEYEKVDWKLNIQKTNIRASGPTLHGK